MNSILRWILVVLCCVAFVETFGQPSDGGSEGPPFPREVASGHYYCSVMVVEPPVGTGIPQAWSAISFLGTSGITHGGLSKGMDLGEGDGMEEKCEALSAQVKSKAQALHCTSGPIRILEHVGGNYTEKSWRFDLVCSDGHNQVMNAIGTLLATIITTPLADEVTLTTDRNDVMESVRRPTRCRNGSD